MRFLHHTPTQIYPFYLPDIKGSQHSPVLGYVDLVQGEIKRFFIGQPSALFP